MMWTYYSGTFFMYDDQGEVLSEHRAFWCFERNYPTEPDHWILQTVDGFEEKYVDPGIWREAEKMDYKVEPDNEYY